MRIFTAVRDNISPKFPPLNNSIAKSPNKVKNSTWLVFI